MQRLFTEIGTKFPFEHLQAFHTFILKTFDIITTEGSENMNKYHQKNTIKITELELIVKDLAMMTDYYTKSLGFEIIKQNASKTVLGVDGAHPIVTLLENKDAKPRGKAIGLYHFAILLPNRYELGKFLRHVINKQIPISGAANHGVSEAFYLQDPEDNGIEVYADTDDSTWYDEFGSLIMYTSEVDYSGIFYEAKENDVFTKLPNDTTIGHLHLSVSSLEKARKYYIDAIGFDVSFDEISTALFAGSNKYHHHLGMNIWQTKKPASPVSTGLKSFVISYPNCESIIATMEKLEKQNYSIKEIENGYQTTDFDGNIVYLHLSE